LTKVNYPKVRVMQNGRCLGTYVDGEPT
jgi:hypothetical protein